MTIIPEIKVADFDYDLPDSRIAMHPLPKREDSKLLVYKDGNIIHEHFYDIANYLPTQTLVLFNNSKVVNARLNFRRETGAEIEIFCVNKAEEYETKYNESYWYCLIGNVKKWRIEETLVRETLLYNAKIKLEANFIKKVDNYFIVKFTWNSNHSFYELLEMFGLVPLPPYIKRHNEISDRKRYQTVYAKQNGSVAAPTAGLHFTDDILHKLTEKKCIIDELTLHVGAGTFMPMKHDTANEHIMHPEKIIVTAKNINNIIHQLDYQYPIAATGTTACRTLESLYWIGIKILNNKFENHGLLLDQWEPYQLDNTIAPIKSLEAIILYMQKNDIQYIEGNTKMMIVPGYNFKLTNILITNFHQPSSTLLMLVSAFTGGQWRDIYKSALENDYRFLSYGDGSILFKSEE